MDDRPTLTRIFSDVHYGDRASRVTSLSQLRPLFEGAASVVCNGDMVDSRIGGPNPAHTAAIRDDVEQLVRTAPAPLTLITGNHDPNLSRQHWAEFNDGAVFAVHGDVLFDSMVPWGRDAAMIRRQIRAKLAAHRAKHQREPAFEERMAIWRDVACQVPQRHQSERRIWKYILNFAVDTIWPPTRVFKIFHAWRVEPVRAAAFVTSFRPGAKFILLGHTHRPAIRRLPNGVIAINTGSFCAPFGGYCVDLTADQLIVRRIDYRRRTEFAPGEAVAEFALSNR